MISRALVVCLPVAVSLLSLPLAAQRPPHAKKQLIAHRGASAYAPEHTLEAYKLAIAQGADFVEQDLAVTRDGVLVCIHDFTLERTTNVEEVFRERFTQEKGGATPERHWPVNDFTLAEIKQLDAGSWFGEKFAGSRIPTFQEAIDVVRGKAGLYPELKDPEFYRDRGVRPESIFADMLRKNRLVGDSTTPVIVQSFDDTTLKALAKDIPQIPRVWLLAPQSADRVDSILKVREIAGWATGLGPHKSIVAARPEVVTWAHQAGLTVTPWTFRADGVTGFTSVRDEMAKFLYEYGADALFTDNPDQFPRR